MTIKQYSTIQRQLGVVEGLLMALDDEKSALGYDAIEVLDSTIDEIWEVEDAETGHSGTASGT